MWDLNKKKQSSSAFFHRIFRTAQKKGHVTYKKQINIRDPTMFINLSLYYLLSFYCFSLFYLCFIVATY